MNHRQHIINLCFSLLPLLALGQMRHWTEQGVEVFFWDDFDTVYHGPDLYFERVAPPEVASQMETLIGQDAAGFIWLTSRSGYILRFDGLRFEQFPTPRPANNRYHAIDKATNSIWLNTMEGLCCLDMANGQWQLYPNNRSLPDSLYSTVFMAPNQQFLYCSSSGNGVFEFDLASQSFSKKCEGPFVDVRSGENLDASTLIITQFQSLADSSFWAACLISNKWWLASWHTQEKAWEMHTSPFFDPAVGKFSTDKSPMHNLYVDAAEGCVWAGGTNGLIRFDPQTRRWKQYLVNDQNHVFISNHLYDILPWGERHLVLTSHRGLLFFDKKTGRFYNHLFFPTTLGSHWSHITHHPLLDRDNRLWVFAGSTGLFRLDPRKQFFSKPKHLPNHFSPNQVYIDSASQTEWLLGLNYDEEFRSGCRIDPVTRQALQFEVPFCHGSFVLKPGGQQAWLTSQILGCLNTPGLWQLDLRSLQCRQIHSHVQGLPTGATTDSLEQCRLARSPNGTLWIGSERFGLLQHDAAAGIFRRKKLQNDVDTLPVANLMVDAKGKLWFLPLGGRQVLRLDPATEQLDSFALPASLEPSRRTFKDQMAQTADGAIWIGIRQRLFRLGTASRGSGFEEVPNIRPAANYLATDDQGNLWCNTTAGLANYSCRFGKWKMLTTQDGLMESPGDEAVSNCHHDRMYLTGAATFRPSQLLFNTAPATPVFTGLRVLEQQREEGRFLNATRRVHLRPGEDALTIEFAATNFTNPEDNQFAYRLVGETDWLDIGTRRSATFTNLAPGNYRFELRAANSDGFWNPKAEALDIHLAPLFYQTVWFKLLAAALALAAVWLFYQNRLKAARQESLLREKDAELRQQQAEFQQQVAELENAALRSQMNPHFIFNVLNSIHYFLDSNDARSASDYLAKFSRLVRLVLEHSSQPSVTLHNDLTALLLYLEMEALRFKGKLTYTLDVAPDIDQKYLRVPPLLIQPFVENAIWHGLMHKHGGGSVNLHIAQPDENLLRVVIMDDGIGRPAALAIKSKSATINKSKGMEISARRLHLLKGTATKQVNIEIHDLTTPDGQSAGTRVVLEIPV